MGFFDTLKNVATVAGSRFMEEVAKSSEEKDEWYEKYSCMSKSELYNEFRDIFEGNFTNSRRGGKYEALKQVCLDNGYIARYTDSNGNTKYRWNG